MNIYLLPAAFLIMVSITEVDALNRVDKTAAPLPSRVDNRATPYFPPVIYQQGESCASANAVGYIFTYEINAARDASVADSANRYPYFGTYNFLNDGSIANGTYTMYIDAWEIIRDNGIHNAVDFGAPDVSATKWVSGYEKYYRAMHNRVATIDSLSFLEAGTLDAVKRWLYNHANGSSSGGIFTVTASAYGVQDAKISTGPEKNKWIIRKFGTSLSSGPHAFAVVGYNDGIMFDYNRDGKVTDTVDINGDKIVDQRDGESGAFILANTWGSSSGDGGFLYAPYRLFMSPIDSGGLISNRAYFITVRREYEPSRTFKVTLDHEHRNMIALSVGIAADTTATVPDHIREVRQFTYSGGDLPMRGNGGSSAIEIGLDVSDLLDSTANTTHAVYFLLVDAKSGEGRCETLSLFDYAGDAPEEWPSPDAPGNLSAGRNIFRIIPPPIGITDRSGSINNPRRPRVRRRGDYLHLYLPTGKIRLAIFRLDGRCIMASTLNGTGGWHSIPVKQPSGSCIIRLTDQWGKKDYFLIGEEK